MNNDQKNFLSKSIQQFQRYVRQSGPAASAAYSLLGSVLLLSIIGYSIDQYYESSPVYLIIGLSLGTLISLYLDKRSVQIYSLDYLKTKVK